ncbi:hypothetical protein MMC21_008195 [Puttea exsequens]|nr:hypothetical protein [Puttea exsequens]
MAMGEIAPWRRKWIEDLYIERSAQSKKCTTNPPELALHGAVVELRRDGRLHDGDLKKDLKLTPFKHCVGTQPKLCRLIQIYLLPVLHKESSPRTLDVFLLFGRVPPVTNKTNCYRRIGLMKLTNEEGKIRTWDKMIDGRMKPQKEDLAALRKFMNDSMADGKLGAFTRCRRKL